jgi:hypothetical protein
VARQRQRAAVKFQLLLEGLGRLRQPQRAAPSAIFLAGVGRHFDRRNETVGRRLALRARRCRKQVEHAVAVPWREGVDINQLRDALSRAVGDGGRDHAAIGMTDQVDRPEVLEFEHAENIGDVRLEIYLGARQLPALAEASIGRRNQPVPARRHQRMHLLPGPAGAPGAMRDDKNCHWLLRRYRARARRAI